MATLEEAAPRRVSRASALLFAGAVAAAVSIVGYFAIRAEGSDRQLLFWDTSWFHVFALSMLDALREDGIGGWLRAWVETAHSHAPLVPAVSSLLMALFGESRSVCGAVLPLSAFLLAFSTFRAFERLYGSATARFAVLLAAAFPVSLTYSHSYYYDYPTAALFAASCQALLASERFARTGPTLLFGVLAGLTALARLGGGIFVVGPTIVVAALALREPDRGRRLARAVAGALVALALAATWYVPNLEELLSYLHATTYGAEAERYTRGSHGLSLDSFLYHVAWIVLDGPGVPMAGVTLLALLVRPRAPRFGVGAALGAAFSLDFLLVLVASQKMGAKFLLPLMPMVALAIVLAVRSVPWRGVRVACAAAVAALALHHVVACTFFPPPQDRAASRPRPFNYGSLESETFLGRLGALWNHGSLYLDWSASGGGNARMNYRVPEVLDRLDRLGMSPTAPIAVLSDNCMFEAGPLTYVAWRRGRRWSLYDPVSGNPDAASLRKSFSGIGHSEAILMLTDGNPGGPSALYADAFRDVNDGVELAYVEEGEPIRLADGSAIRIFRPAGPSLRISAPHPRLVATDVRFESDGATAFEIEGVRGPEGIGPLLLGLRFPEVPSVGPTLVVSLFEGDIVAITRAIRVELPSDPPPAGTPFRVLVRLRIPLAEREDLIWRGYSVGLSAPPLAVRSSLPGCCEGAGVRVWEVPPRAADSPPPKGHLPEALHPARGADR